MRRALTDDGRAAAGRTDAFRVVVYVEVATGSPAVALESRVADSVQALAGADADTVVFLATGDAPDPEPLIAACAAWRR